MADDFKALVELTKQTNAKLELLHRQGDEDDLPKERLLDALPEVLTARKISKIEIKQKDKIHKEEVKKHEQNLENLKKADAERSKSIKQQNQIIVSEGHKDTSMIVDSLGGVEQSQSKTGNFFHKLLTGDKIFEKSKPKSQGSAATEDDDKKDSMFKKLFTNQKEFNEDFRKSGFYKFADNFGKKTGASFMSKLFKVGLIGGLLFLVDFINGPNFNQFYNTVVDTLVPALVKIYDVLKPIVLFLGGILLDLFIDIGDLLGGGEEDEFSSTNQKSLFSVLMENKLAILTIIAALAPFKLLRGIMKIPLLLSGAFKLVSMTFGGIIRGIQLAAGAAVGGNLVKGSLKAGTVNKATGNLVGVDGRDTTIKSTDKGFKAAQSKVQNLSKKASKGNLDKVSGIGKFKNLFKVARAFWPLNAILSSVMGVQILLSDAPMKTKIQQLGGLVGQALGATGFAALGAVMGSVLGPIGSIAGGLIGGLGGAIGGEALGQKLVGLMLGDEKSEIDKALGGEPSSERRASKPFKTPTGLTKEIMRLPQSQRLSKRKEIALAKKSQKFSSAFLGEGDSFFSGLGEIPIEQKTIQKRSGAPLSSSEESNKASFSNVDASTKVFNKSDSSVSASVPLVDFSHFGQLAHHGHPNN